MALGISERTLRSMLPRLPTVRTGSAVLIPVELLRAWLREEAQKKQSDLNTIADEVLRELDDASEY